MSSGSELLSRTVNCIRLLLLTGCRLSEIQKLKWDHVDLNARVLRLPDSKTGAKLVAIGSAAVNVFKSIARLADNPYVITGQVKGQRLTDMQRPWRRIRKRAGLDDVRIHDLRHSCASDALQLGEDLPMIGNLLGHTQVQTTARYAHLKTDPIRAAADKVSGPPRSGCAHGERARLGASEPAEAALPPTRVRPIPPDRLG